MVKNLPASAGDAGGMYSIPGSGRSPGEGNGNPLQIFCQGNSMDRGNQWAIQSTGWQRAVCDRATDQAHGHLALQICQNAQNG